MAENEFFQAFGRLEGKVDLLVTALPSLEGRLRTLENWRWKQAGAGAVAGAVVSCIVSIIVAVLLKRLS